MTRVGWHIRLAALLTLAATSAAVIIVLLVSGPSDADSGTVPHRALAGHEANRLIAAVRLPHGAVPVTSRTASATALASIDRAAPDVVERSRDWAVAEPAATVRAFLASHPPPGTRRTHAGALRFQAHSGLPQISAATLTLTVLATGARTSTVRAEARVRWLVTRSAAEQVPPEAHELVITRGPEDRMPTLRIRVTDPARIARIRALLDRLPPVQPGRVYHCPAQFPEIPVVRFVFRSGAAGSHVLAVATEPADVRSPTTACDALQLTLAGRAQAPLLGGYRLLRQVSALLGRRLWTAPYAA